MSDPKTTNLLAMADYLIPEHGKMPRFSASAHMLTRSRRLIFASISRTHSRAQ